MKVNLFPENIKAMTETIKPDPEKAILEQVCEDLTKILDISYPESYTFIKLLMFSLKQENFEEYLKQYFNYRFKEVVRKLEEVLNEKYPKYKINYDYADHAKLNDIVELLEEDSTR